MFYLWLLNVKVNDYFRFLFDNVGSNMCINISLYGFCPSVSMDIQPSIDFCPIAITMTLWWTRWRLKASASRVFTQPFIRAQIKENIKAPRHWPLWEEFTRGRWIPPHKGPVTSKMFPFDDVIMAVEEFYAIYSSPVCNDRYSSKIRYCLYCKVA